MGYSNYPDGMRESDIPGWDDVDCPACVDSPSPKPCECLNDHEPDPECELCGGEGEIDCDLCEGTGLIASSEARAYRY